MFINKYLYNKMSYVYVTSYCKTIIIQKYNYLYNYILPFI